MVDCYKLTNQRISLERIIKNGTVDPKRFMKQKIAKGQKILTFNPFKFKFSRILIILK